MVSVPVLGGIEGFFPETKIIILSCFYCEVLEFRIPRDRYDHFHPKILTLLRDQELECERLTGVLYARDLTQSQVGDIFEDIYGEHYSKASISRMIVNFSLSLDNFYSQLS